MKKINISIDEDFGDIVIIWFIGLVCLGTYWIPISLGIYIVILLYNAVIEKTAK